MWSCTDTRRGRRRFDDVHAGLNSDLHAQSNDGTLCYTRTDIHVITDDHTIAHGDGNTDTDAYPYAPADDRRDANPVLSR